MNAQDRDHFASQLDSPAVRDTSGGGDGGTPDGRSMPLEFPLRTTRRSE
jgi:hypothetical protein